MVNVTFFWTGLLIIQLGKETFKVFFNFSHEMMPYSFTPQQQSTYSP